MQRKQLLGVLITVSSIAGFAWALGRDPSHATTVCFMTLALAQIFHLGNARSVEAVVRPARVAANPYALGAVALSIGLQLLSIYARPLAGVLRVERLGPIQWIVILVLAAIPAAVGQAIKLWRVRRWEAVKPAGVAGPSLAVEPLVLT